MLDDDARSHRGEIADALPHRRQPVLARALRGARRVPRAHSRATQRLAAAADRLSAATRNEWESARRDRRLRCDAFYERTRRRTRRHVIDFLAFSRDNPSSIRNCFEIARTNARSVRTALTARNVGGDQRRLARAAAARQRRRASRERVRALPRLGEGHARCASTARPTAPCCATTPTGSRGSAFTSSAPTTPRASST